MTAAPIIHEYHQHFSTVVRRNIATNKSTELTTKCALAIQNMPIDNELTILYHIVKMTQDGISQIDY